jgi:23S rRNA (uridine2552-2'-O)-methyltransferase
MSRSRGKNRLRKKRGRSTSQQQWLERQLNDPYVEEAQQRGYRARSAFKLIEIADKAGLDFTGARVVDLGAAPGGWAQVAVERGGARVVALDLLAIDPLEGVTGMQKDFMDHDAPGALREVLGGVADVVMSDMAPNMTGHQQTDHLKIMNLVEAAYDFAGEVLSPGGAFIAKVFQGGAEDKLLKQMKRDFAKARHIKPPASRKESPEIYVVATGWRGAV